MATWRGGRLSGRVMRWGVRPVCKHGACGRPSLRHAHQPQRYLAALHHPAIARENEPRSWLDASAVCVCGCVASSDPSSSRRLVEMLISACRSRPPYRGVGWALCCASSAALVSVTASTRLPFRPSCCSSALPTFAWRETSEPRPLYTTRSAAAGDCKAVALPHAAGPCFSGCFPAPLSCWMGTLLRFQGEHHHYHTTLPKLDVLLPRASVATRPIARLRCADPAIGVDCLTPPSLHNPICRSGRL